MKRYQKTICFLMLLFSLMLLIACGEEEETTTSPPPALPKAVTVTFFSDGGTEIAPVSVPVGQSVAKPNEPVKKDYDFLGWYVGDTPYDFSSAVTADLTLSAKWVPTVNPATLSGKWVGIEQAGGKSYTHVLLFSQSGAATLSVTCDGVTVSPELTNVKSVRGHLCLSYRLEDGSVGVMDLSVSDSLMGTGLYGGAVTLQKTEAFTVSYHPYRGAVIHQSIDQGASFAHPDVALGDGILLDGWYTAEGLKIENGTPVTEHVELYASVYTEGLQIEGEMVTGYTGSHSRVVMPNYYQGTPVTVIAEEAFANASFESVDLPNGLQTIERAAFSGCGNLLSIDLKNVTRIEEKAFFDCAELLSVHVPDSVAFIGKGAFGSSLTYREHGEFSSLMAVESSLTRISLPFLGSGDGTNAFLAYLFGAEAYSDVCYYEEGIETTVNGETKTVHLIYPIPVSLAEVTVRADAAIPAYAFYNCFYVSQISLAGTVKEIGAGAFEGCSGILELNGTESVERIGERAFFGSSYGGEKLTSVVEIGDMAFAYSAVKRILLPTTLRHIGKLAFAYTLIDMVTFPKEIESIGSNAFFGCNALTSVNFTANEPCDIGSLLFTTVDESGTVYYSNAEIWVPNGEAYRAYRRQVYLRDYAASIYPASAKEKTGYVVQGNVLLGYIGDEKLTAVNVPDGVKEIADFAFYNCSTIVDVMMPEGFEKIGEYAFYNCTSVKNLYVPSTLREIDDYAFTGFFVGNNISRLYLPEGFERIGEGAFMSSYNLRIVEFPSTLNYIGYLAFGMSNSLEQMYFASSVPPQVGSFQNDQEEIYHEIFSIVNAGKTVIYVPFGTQNGVSVVDSYRQSPGFVQFAEYIKAKPDGKEVGHYGDGTWFLDLDGCDRAVLSYLREAENDTSDNGGFRYEMVEEIGTYTMTGSILRMDFPTRGTVIAVYSDRSVQMSLDGSFCTLKEPKFYYDSYNWTNFRLYPTGSNEGEGLFDMYGSFLTPFHWKIEGQAFFIWIDGNNKLPEHTDYAGVVQYVGTYDRSPDSFSVSFMLNDYEEMMNFHTLRNDVVYASGESTRLYGTYRAYAETNPEYAMFTLVSYGNGIVDVSIGEQIYKGCSYTVKDGVVTIDFQTLTLTFVITKDGHLTGEFLGTPCYFVYEDELMDSTKMPGRDDAEESVA